MQLTCVSVPDVRTSQSSLTAASDPHLYNIYGDVCVPS
jgi:hypothetical protein